MQSWTAGILCYNESGSIQQVIQDTVKVVSLISEGDYEVLVIDDCSTDNSKQLIEEMEVKYPNVRLIHHSQNLGIGGALRSIYNNAVKENVVTICGDGQFDLHELLPIKGFNQNEFIAFYRLQNTQYSGFRNFLSFFNKWFNQYMLKIFLQDVNWVKAYKTDIIKALDLKITSSLVESEICSKLMHAGAKPLEYESKYLPRTSGESKGSSWRIVRKAIGDMWKLLLVVKKFNRKNANKLRNKISTPS